MSKIISLVSVAMLSGCAIYSHETMISTYVLEGGIDYYLVEKKNDDLYQYEVRIYEKTKSGGDLHSYETNTTELRMKTARHLLSSKYHTGCTEVGFVSESSYQDHQQSKLWLRGTWWSVQVLCEGPKNPRANKYS